MVVSDHALAFFGFLKDDIEYAAFIQCKTQDVKQYTKF